uniref:C2H2-type domain-containing protein n=1 Tax=Steinernema glaseri TaxID=37863 RepID=A0A1I7Y3Y0_9BILA
MTSSTSRAYAPKRAGMIVPCLICELGSDGGDADENGNLALSFEAGQHMRDHLVDAHAAFVARAMLAPDMLDKIHVWLYSNVEYHNTVDTTEDTDPMALLSVLMNGLDEDDSAQEDLQDLQKNRRKRAQPLRLDEDESASKKSPPMFSDLFPQLFDNLLEQSESPPPQLEPEERTDGLIDSKAMRKTTCKVCNLKVCSTARQRHVYMIHVNQKDMFMCSVCGYKNSNSVWEMRKHCTAQHEGQAHAVSNEEKYRKEIQHWNVRCFPDWKHKKPSMWSRPPKTENKENGEKDVSETPSLDEDNDSEAESTFDDSDAPLQVDEDVDEEASVSSSHVSKEASENGNALQDDDKICQLCGEESRYPGRHIAQKHLQKHLYECPLCESFGSYESCTVQKHIYKVHPDAGTTYTPISHLEGYAEEIRELQQACFPNRPMKLVRPVIAGNRPRERHLCKMCDVEVAQSDRQRHVYHRHLGRPRLFECPFCEFSSNYDVHRVKNHIKWEHKHEGDLEPISHESECRDEINDLNEKCFPGWQHRRKPTDYPQSSRTPNMGSDFICQLCFKEFKPSSNFLRHVAKDHLKIPLYQCPICEEHGGQDAYDVRTHMMRIHSHVDGVAKMEPISNVDTKLDEIQEVYQQCFPGRKFKNTLKMEQKVGDEPRVQCRECGMEMKTEDRQIHVYRHHLKEARLYECPLCSFSHHACSSDVKAHIKYAHREQADMNPKSNLILFSKEISEWNDRCFPGWINRRLPAAALEDFNRCRLCNIEVRQTSRHIAEQHLRIPLHQCPICDYGAAESRLVRRHMRNYHDKKEIKGLDPVANVVERRNEFSELHDRCFPGRPKRLSNITISDEGRRAKCKLCGATISKKKRLGHLLEQHFHEDVYKCPECDFSSRSDKAIIAEHMKSEHGETEDLEPVSSLELYIDELKAISKRCFNDSELKL